MRRLLFFFLMVAGSMLFFMDMEHRPGSVLSQVSGAGHLVFFMFVAVMLSRHTGFARRPVQSQFFLIMCVVLSVGGIVELIQPYFGRSASWRDVRLNLVGAFLGLMFFAPARFTLVRRVLVLGQVAAVVLTVAVFYKPVTTLWDIWQASRQFPVLSDFETAFEKGRWSSGEIEKGLARNGERSLRISLGTKKYAGTTLVRSFGDWRGFSTFAFSLYNPDPDSLRIVVSIRDGEHFRRGGEYHDRFNRAFTVEQGWNDIYIPVSDIENAPSSRRLDLSRLSEVVIFTVNPSVPRVVYLDYVRLVR